MKSTSESHLSQLTSNQISRHQHLREPGEQHSKAQAEWPPLSSRHRRSHNRSSIRGNNGEKMNCMNFSTWRGSRPEGMHLRLPLGGKAALLPPRPSPPSPITLKDQACPSKMLTTSRMSRIRSGIALRNRREDTNVSKKRISQFTKLTSKRQSRPLRLLNSRVMKKRKRSFNRISLRQLWVRIQTTRLLQTLTKSKPELATQRQTLSGTFQIGREKRRRWESRLARVVTCTSTSWSNEDSATIAS